MCLLSVFGVIAILSVSKFSGAGFSACWIFFPIYFLAGVVFCCVCCAVTCAVDPDEVPISVDLKLAFVDDVCFCSGVRHPTLRITLLTLRKAQVPLASKLYHVLILCAGLPVYTDSTPLFADQGSFPPQRQPAVADEALNDID